MKSTLHETSVRDVVDRLERAHARHAASFPGERAGRQPVHVVYGGAHLFRVDMPKKLGAAALAALDEHAPDGPQFAAAFGIPSALAATVRERVVEKLRREPVEDLRIDFEDGFGARPDDEEDETAVRCAGLVARAMEGGTLPPFSGIRVKSFSRETFARAVRTLDLFVTGLAAETGGALPPGFVVTLPKVTIAEEVAAAVDLFEILERSLGLREGALRLEIMVETPQAIFDAEGRVPLESFVRAARGRCEAAHFGTYDYTAACDVTATHQSMTHPAASFARHVMQVALAGTGVRISDGATNVMPVPIHRAKDGPLSPEEVEENRALVHAAWRLHVANVTDSLVRGLHQGWDLHPAQLPARYAAVHAFYLQGLDAAAERLAQFVARAARASLVGNVFDDAATGQGLLNFFLRAMHAGALAEDEVVARTGLTLEELRLRSFAKILERRATARP